MIKTIKVIFAILFFQKRFYVLLPDGYKTTSFTYVQAKQFKSLVGGKIKFII